MLMAVHPQGMTIHPSLRNGLNRLMFTETEQPANHSSRGDLDKNDMVKAYRIKSVRDLEASLNVVSLDDCNKDCMDSLRRASVGSFRWIPSEPVRNSQDGTNLVYRHDTVACKPGTLRFIPDV